MIYFLDTSLLVDLLRKKKEIGDFIILHEDDIFITSVLCEFELLHGIYKLSSKEKSTREDQVKKLLDSLYEVIDFTSDQADIAGSLSAELETRGQRLEDLDILIAAAAISRRATLVTKNAKHFSRINNLSIITI